MKTTKKPTKKPAAKKASSAKKSSKVTNFQPTYVALAVASVAVVSLVAFAVIGWSMSL